MDKKSQEQIVLHALTAMAGMGSTWATTSRRRDMSGERGKVGTKRPKKKKTFGKNK